MRFEIPKFETPKFADEPDDLPADLAEVAAQLSADANWLSSTYPSKAVAPVATVRSSKNYWALVAAVLIAVGATGWWQLTGDRCELPRVVRVAAPPEIAASPDEPDTKQAVVPPVVFQELTSPEQEAVLDLLEGQPASLSI